MSALLTQYGITQWQLREATGSLVPAARSRRW